MSEVLIIQEFCSRGDLREALKHGKLEGQRMGEGGKASAPDLPVALTLALDIAAGVAYIHNMNVRSHQRGHLLVPSAADE